MKDSPSSDPEIYLCSNCGFEFEGNFCSKCGTPVKKGRYTPKRLKEETIDTFEIKSGFFKTLLQLIINPGKTILNHINGETEIFNPLKVLLILGAISTYCTAKYYNFGVVESLSYMEGLNLKLHLEYHEYSGDYFTLTNLVGTPIFALVSWLIFRNMGYNYTEHLILNTYITVIQLFIIVVGTPFIYLSGNNELLLGILLGLQTLYQLITFVVFFKSKLVFTVAKTGLVMLFGYVLAYFTNYLIFRILPESLLQLFEIF